MQTAIEACQTLVDRLKPYAGEGSWVDVVAKAEQAGVDLSASALHTLTDGGDYFCYGCVLFLLLCSFILFQSAVPAGRVCALLSSTF